MDRGGAGQARAWVSASSGALLISTAPIATLAQTYSFSSVRVEGNQRIETGTILAEAGISQGETVTAGQLNDAAQAIRASGLFETVEVVPQGSTLVIRVQELPVISRINFEGNTTLKDEDLAQLIGSVERRIYSPTQAEQDTAAIAQAYVNAGRVNAVVTPAIIPREGGTVDLVFQIAEGGVTEIERISFVGNRAFSDGRLRNVLETRQAGLLRAIIRADTFVAERIDFDRQLLTDFYRSRGYADFTVNDVNANLTNERDAYLITFNVTEGPRFRFGDVTLSSEVPEADPNLFRGLVRVQAGDLYSPVAIENDVSRIEAQALREGINFIRVDPRISRDERGQILNLDYVLVPGERIFVERIDIEGNATTLDRVIRSQFNTVEGDPFNPREIREAAERIRALGYFANADVEAREGASPDQVIVDVNVEEQPTGTLSFGVNYSSENGPALIAAFSEENFLGRGQSLDFQLSTGEDNRLLTFAFEEPRFMGRDLALGLDLSYRQTDNASALYDTDQFRLSPSLGFPISERGRLDVFYAVEYNDITDVAGSDTPNDPTDDASPIIEFEAAQGGQWSNSVGFSYSFDTARNNIDTPTNFSFRAGQEYGFGDRTFIQTTALASAETRVLGEDLLLRATVEGGYLHFSQGESRVTDRFFLGSSRIRGFERGGIGPRDAKTDDALGGNAYAVVRLEAEFPLPVPEEYGVSGGAFLDYGSVWNVGAPDRFQDRILYDDFTPRTVAGLSLFWDTPLGPLRFNFTEPLQVEEQDRTQNFDVTVSTRF
ncbi:Outer membrane protein assembly factor YaeT precursor [Rubellimicrobium mesophilum DSM 19309]|uniref:Outer membrane protein assembly factor BamA n=1 Tax=Rubellimicrobium mesophilum DSM 19309 TaxID=442562 RepID=A0A017HSF1_9RHOB|nr:outer membrane protein assembly factor BamA [Rubellimicrobium mesophilum]EYD77265.1 Outer membrane protein assembly factor YaeT precursor [Rubellimicrobium mesophilum DSM 19309]